MIVAESLPRTIALDAMGGDFAPEAPASAAAILSHTTDIRLLLVGDSRRIEPLLDRHRADRTRIEILDARDAVPMAEDPHAALAREGASIALAVGALSDRRADALVSAGNTGATLLHVARAIPRLPGIRRAALAAVHPTLPRPHNPDPFALLLDVGASTTCAPEDLVQFALMGSAYAARISKVRTPTVGLLNIGEEPGKGDDTLRRAHILLSEAKGISFAGNVEGRGVPLGVVDVVVCPGLLGNVVLKLLESQGELLLGVGRDTWRRRLDWRIGSWLLRGGIEQLTRVFDYAAYGGAPILGFERMVIKAHGRSTASALVNAVKVAAKAVRDDVCGAIAEGIAGLGHPAT